MSDKYKPQFADTWYGEKIDTLQLRVEIQQLYKLLLELESRLQALEQEGS